MCSYPLLAAPLQSFITIFEPSGLTHVGNGEFILVEDEVKQPFHRLKVSPIDGLIELGEVAIVGDGVRLNDLEGVAFDGRYLYAITSHSLTKKGKTGRDRTQLVRFEYLNGELHQAGRVQDLKPALVRRFSSSMPEKSKDKISASINIEALAWSPLDESLYVGFRKPRLNGKSAVLRIHQPGLMFEQQTAEGFEISVSWLDLGGDGIRSMNWNPTLQGLVIVSGGKKSSGKGFELWQWPAMPDSPALKITNLEAPLPAGTEGLATFIANQQSGLLLVIDDGKAKKEKGAHYQLFWFDAL